MKKYQLDLSGDHPVISLIPGREGVIGSYEICKSFSMARKGTVGYVIDPPLAFMGHDDIVKLGKGLKLPFAELDEIGGIEKEYRLRGAEETVMKGVRKILPAPVGD